MAKHMCLNRCLSLNPGSLRSGRASLRRRSAPRPAPRTKGWPGAGWPAAHPAPPRSCLREPGSKQLGGEGSSVTAARLMGKHSSTTVHPLVSYVRMPTGQGCLREWSCALPVLEAHCAAVVSVPGPVGASNPHLWAHVAQHTTEPYTASVESRAPGTGTHLQSLRCQRHDTPARSSPRARRSWFRVPSPSTSFAVIFSPFIVSTSAALASSPTSGASLGAVLSVPSGFEDACNLTPNRALTQGNTSNVVLNLETGRLTTTCLAVNAFIVCCCDNR